MSAQCPPDKSGGGGNFAQLLDKLPTAKLHWVVPPLVEALVLVLLRYFLLPGGEIGAILQFLLASAIAAVWFIRNYDGWLTMTALAGLCFIICVPGAFRIFLLLAMIAAVIWLTHAVNQARRRRVPAPVVAQANTSVPSDPADQSPWYKQ